MKNLISFYSARDALNQSRLPFGLPIFLRLAELARASLVSARVPTDADAAGSPNLRCERELRPGDEPSSGGSSGCAKLLVDVRASAYT